MTKRMMALSLIGSLALALGATGCDDGIDEPHQPLGTNASQTPGTSIGQPSTSSPSSTPSLPGSTPSSTPESTPSSTPGSTPSSTPGNTPAAATGLGCKDLFDCYATCAQNDNTCIDACWAKGSPEGQQIENAMWACAQQNNCQDWTCIEQACGTQMQACINHTTQGGTVGTTPTPPTQPSGGLSCSGLFQCYGQCAQNDNACVDSCWAQGSPQGQQTENAIWACAQQYNCQDWQCVEQSCGAQLQACFQ